MYSQTVRGRGKQPKRNVNHTNTSSDNSFCSKYGNQDKFNKKPFTHDICCAPISIALEVNCDDELYDVFSELQRMYKMFKDSPPVANHLLRYYYKCDNPYEKTLQVLYNCQDFFNAKTKSLPFFIVKNLRNWKENHKNEHLLTADLQIDAFKLTFKQNNIALTKLIFECYELKNNANIFLQLINCLISRRQYKEACYSAMFLNLSEHFSIHDFLIPLILQDKLVIVDEYLASYPIQQGPVAQFLDEILGKTSMKEAISEYITDNKIPSVNYSKLHPKPWKKAIVRYVKMFNISADLTPNLNKRRNEGALQFLLHKRYIDGTFSNESWKEMVQEAVGNDFDLQKELVYQISCYGEFGEALYWAHFYNVSKDSWPQAVRMLDENKQKKCDTSSEEQVEYWDDEDNNQVNNEISYHKFALDVDDICLVEDHATFTSFLETGLKDVDIVGVDCEWKPSFAGHFNELALMQIATRNRVYIIDVISLGALNSNCWQQLSRVLFNNCDILKLGFGFTSDFSVIQKSIPELNFNSKQVGILDLLSLWRHTEQYPKVKFPYEVSTGGPSLSTLVHLCFGAPLNKSEQFSNWEKRPLRLGQLIYAALDAHCLIEIYDVMKRCCENGEFPFDDVCYNLMTNESASKKKSKKSSQKKETIVNVPIVPQPPSPFVENIEADNIKFVCDTSCQGLGKNLRRCGIDTVILENNQDHMECVKQSNDEKRMILTRGTIFNKLMGYVPHGHCYKLVSDHVDEQLKEVVDYYKIIVKKEHVFSRCQFCNGNSFVKVSRSTMKALASRDGKQRFPEPSDLMDEATGFSSEEEDFEPGPPIGYESKPPCSSNNRKWDLYSDEKIDVGLGQTRLGVKIQMGIPLDVINNIDMFYICEECGKVYWDGSHFGKVVSGRLSEIVT